MDKEVFKKVIESHGCLNSTDLSANEKKALVYLMGKYGATMGTGGEGFIFFLSPFFPATKKKHTDKPRSKQQGLQTEMQKIVTFSKKKT